MRHFSELYLESEHQARGGLPNGDWNDFSSETHAERHALNLSPIASLPPETVRHAKRNGYDWP